MSPHIEHNLHGEVNLDVTTDSNDACPKVFDAENASAERKPSKVKFVLSVGVVIFSMVFNGTIYGYTSPALLSMRQSAAKQLNQSRTFNNNNINKNNNININNNNNNNINNNNFTAVDSDNIPIPMMHGSNYT
jgi:hypothetical protein